MCTPTVPGASTAGGGPQTASAKCKMAPLFLKVFPPSARILGGKGRERAEPALHLHNTFLAGVSEPWWVLSWRRGGPDWIFSC